MTKMLFITCNVSAINEVTELLNKAKVDNYQIIDRVIGILPVGEPRMDNPVWPGYSNLIMLSLPGERLGEITRLLEQFNANLITDEERLFYYSWTID